MGPTRNVLLTGYWPPTNEMLRRFSTSPDLNPDGWQGQDWHGHGYDVHAFFPEFEEDGPPYGAGTGDFRVDYQDTSSDWWRITDDLRPIAIITFSRGSSTHHWEVEAFAENHDSWHPDYEDPRQPTPSPPDDSVPPGHKRWSTLPTERIVDEVDRAGIADVDAYLDDWASAGDFLSEYIAYHGMWYQALQSEGRLHGRCIAAGHIHVGGLIDVEAARRAVDVTLDTVLPDLHDRVLEVLHVRDVATTCGGATGPVSVQRDVFDGGPGQASRSLRDRLEELVGDCR